MTATTGARRIACAIYTRKSTDDGMDKEFTSIEAQRLAAEQYIERHQAQGYYALPDLYDDPGYTGGNLNRPAFKRLLADVEAGRVGCVMVYKTDRLSRSLFDGLMTIKMLRDRGVEFISVTEKIDAPESIEKLIRNNLLVTGEYYRDLTSERIRDKIRLAKEKGMNCGGTPPIGYDVIGRKLAVNDAEAETVRHIFRRFAECGSTTQLVRELKADGIRTKSWITQTGRKRLGKPFNKQNLYRLLHNRKYLGEVPHKDKVYKGEHQAIVDRELWDAVHAIIARNPHERANGSRAKTNGLLQGILKCAHCAAAMQPTWSAKNGRRYHYYLCGHAAKHGHGECPIKSIPAGDIDAEVVTRVRAMLADPAIRREVAKAFGADSGGVDPAEAAAAIVNLEGTWDELFPAEQARLVRMLVQRVEARTEGLTITFRDSGIAALAKMLADAPDDPANALPPPKPSPRGGSGFLEPEAFVPEGKQVTVPMKLMRRSGRKVVIPAVTTMRPQGQAPAMPTTVETNPLTLALARGFRWRALLETGEYATHHDLAKCLGVTRPYVSRMVRLTLLAPDIIETILDGREPSGLSVEALAVEELPGEWGDQRKEFGFQAAG